MRHCDPETLALAALGERIAPEDAAHLDTCEQCITDVAELVEVVTLGREAPAELPPVPDSVWQAVQTELGMGRDAASDPTARPDDVPSTLDPAEEARVLALEP